MSAAVARYLKSKTVTAQPGSPTNGDEYFLPASATGAQWAGQDGFIASYVTQLGGWIFSTISKAGLYEIEDDGNIYVYTGSFTPIQTGTSSVQGPASVTDARVAAFDGTTGKLIKQGTQLVTDLVTGPASSVASRIATFSGTGGKTLLDGGNLISDLILKSVLTTTGDLLYASGASTPARLAAGGARQVVIYAGGVPTAGDQLFQTEFKFSAYSALAANTLVSGDEGLQDFYNGVKVPTGKSFYVMGAVGRVICGATAGTYTCDIGIYDGTTFTSLASNTGTANADVAVSAFGTLASPLATMTAGTVIKASIRNHTGSPGALANSPHTCVLWGYYA